MYKAFYGFREKPFNLVPNPSYLFLSERHATALTYLEYGLKEKVGFVMLTGEIGIGKTTLVRYLLNQIEADVDVAVIFNTNVLSDELIRLILNEFEIVHDDGISKSRALEILYEYLIERYAAGRNVLLIIDEAQNLTEPVLEEIRMLSNLQTDEEMLLQIMIVGQPELREKLTDPRLEQFAQRIAVSYHLSAMNQAETGEYIAHRIEKAGGDPDLFTQGAIDKIFEASCGIPRTINLLCDACLVYSYADGSRTIVKQTVEQVIEDKGGVGIITRKSHTDRAASSADPSAADSSAGSALSESPSSPPPPSDQFRNPNDTRDLLQKITRLEKNFLQLKKLYHTYVKEMDSRAAFCRDAMVSDLKTNLAKERARNEKLALEYGRLQERYRLLLHKFQKRGLGNEILKGKEL
jgi:general secretion pathway protein A